MVSHYDATQYVDEKGRLRADVLRAIAQGTAVPGAMPFEPAVPVNDLAAQIEAAIAAAQAKKKKVA
jgi:antitoxin component of RelBE/YafQ-DinJ toxin-antitoxin module